jgi:hypothetical protein
MAVAAVGVVLSVARNVTAFPVTEVGAVGVPVTWLPAICSPCGSVPELTEYVTAPVPPVADKLMGVIAVPTI